MRFILQRYSDNRESTLGLLFVESAKEGKKYLYFVCYTLEDEYREVKVKSETRIPEGIYKLGVQEQETALTLKYRSKFPWFKNHIHIKDVPNFTGVYIHIGNTDIDSAGCILVGDNADNNQLSAGSISNSTQAFRRLYNNYYDAIEKGGCTLEVRGESYLQLKSISQNLNL